MFMLWLAMLGGTPSVSHVLQAQTPAPASAAPSSTALTAAADSITAAELVRHVGVIAHDSMGGRDTPSPGLTHTAQYVGDQFRALGLKPGAWTDTWHDTWHDTSWTQYYPIPGQLQIGYDTARVLFDAKITLGGREMLDEAGDPRWRELRLNFRTDVRPASDTVRLPFLSFGSAGGKGVLVAGPHTVATLREAQLGNKVVIYVPAAGTDSATRHQVIRELIATSLGVAVVSDEDSVTFAQRAQAARQRPYWFINPYLRYATTQTWGVYVRTAALRELLEILGVDPAEARAMTQPVIRLLPALEGFDLDPAIDTTTVKPLMAPNVVGVLPGTDPTGGYVVLSAHLDNDGRPGGANDNALGVAGLLALAKALSQPGARPRCSVLFLATSGGAKEFWGARYFVHESPWHFMRPRLNITLDLLGRGARDSVSVAGLPDVELSPRPEWLAAMHPELGLTLVDVGTAVTPESDHFAFLERVVPSLYFSNGSHAAPSPGPDTPAQLDTAQAARILRLVFYLTEAAANADREPKLTVEGRHRRIEVFGQ